MQRKIAVEVTQALCNYPYFILNNEIKTGTNLFKQELREIQQNYIDYRKGVEFATEGTSGDYVPSMIRFKQTKSLIDKQARFMFSQTPDINIQETGTDDEEEEQIKQYQKFVDEVLKRSKFSRRLLQSAKDCFIGKRVAMLVDFDEQDGTMIHFYNSLQFYYETDYGSDRITKFICFENVNKTKSNREKLYLVNRYEEIENKIYLSSILYDGIGNEIEVLIDKTQLDLKYIPVVIVTNDGLLIDKDGISEIEDLIEYEAGYSKLANGDIDSERKGMNPIRYTVDMSPNSTKSLPSGAGAYWDLKHDQNMNDPKPSVGTLAPAMNHTESVKTTLERIKTSMHNSVDVPDISQEGLLSGITSFKALKALYYPLMTRCNEKLMVWKPALESLIRMVIEVSLFYESNIIELYELTQFNKIPFNVEVVENYALLDDEEEEKNIDLAEIAQNTRSRKSYIKKWRKSEFKNDEQIDRELMQIAMEINMFDTMSMNTQVQSELNKQTTEQNIEEEIEGIQVKENIEKFQKVEE